ncbi:MAG: type IV secretory system conjugative DNA transfer family protein [Solirubrobacterales bacterium]
MFSDALLGVLFIFGGGYAIARTLRTRELLWTCAAPGLPAGFVLWQVTWPLGLTVMGACLYACSLGRRWHRTDLAVGGDHAAIALARLGIGGVLERHQRQQTAREGFLTGGHLIVGRDEHGLPVSIPVGYQSGRHTLVLGATGAGKTVSEAWVTTRLIDTGYGGITLDPKGDTMLHDELERAANRTGRPFFEWTPEGPLAYNPYTHGTDTEIADKALSGEHFTEPHYLRQAQRYLGHAVRVMHTAQVPVTPASLMAHLDPRQLEVSARQLPGEDAKIVLDYLDSLSERQKHDLGGVRDRLSILAESDARQWLNPNGSGHTLDLQRAVNERAVVYFRLDSDRRPLLSAMLAAAIVGDLVTLSTRTQQKPVPTVVLIDEFSAILAGQVSRLFGRARTAGFSLILATQELADMQSAANGELRDQVIGNLASVIAHRQTVPESAEMIAQIAGSKPVWLSTQQTQHVAFGSPESGRGSRRRGQEPNIDPNIIKNLQTGEAAVITPGTDQPPTITHMHHPDEAHT